MKKLLLATTAVAGLVAFGASEAKADIDLSLGGYFQGYFGYVDQDDNARKDFDFLRDAQIQFHGETALDNGLIVGAHAELQMEANNLDNGSRFEESYIFFSSEYGRVNLGAENGAAYLLQVAAPAADANIDGFDPNFAFVNSPVRDTYKNVVGNENADKITYITPKVSGFQAAVSYASTNEQRTLGSALNGTTEDAVFDVDGLTNGLRDSVELAARYDGMYEGVNFHLGAGYTNSNGKNGFVDEESWNAGFAVEYAGFGLGFNYTEAEGGVYTTSDFETIDETFDGKQKIFYTGLDYTTGAYKFGVSMLNTEEKALGVKQKLDRYSFGAQYAFGPGMTFNGSVHIYDFDGVEFNEFGSYEDAVAVVLGTDIAF